MTIGTSDGKSYKNEMSYLLDQHNNLSQEAQVADLDKRVPPPLPMVPSHSIAPHNPNPPGGGPYQIRPGERLAQAEIVEDVKTPLPRPDPRKGELGMQDSTPKDPLDPLFDPFLRTQSDVPIQRPNEFDRQYRMPSGGYFMEQFLRKKSDEGDVLEQPKFPINKGEPKGKDLPPRKNTPKERLT